MNNFHQTRAYVTALQTALATAKARAEKAEALVRLLAINCASVSSIEALDAQQQADILAIVSMPGMRNDS